MIDGNLYPIPKTWTESSIGEVVVKAKQRDLHGKPVEIQLRCFNTSTCRASRTNLQNHGSDANIGIRSAKPGPGSHRNRRCSLSNPATYSEETHVHNSNHITNEQRSDIAYHIHPRIHSRIAQQERCGFCRCGAFHGFRLCQLEGSSKGIHRGS